MSNTIKKLEAARQSQQAQLAALSPATQPTLQAPAPVMANQAPPPRTPLMSVPFTGFGDPETIEDFLYIWNLQSLLVPADSKKGELMRCLDRKAIFALRNAGHDLATLSYDQILPILKTTFARPRLTVSEAQANLRSISLKPGQTTHEFQSELNLLAVDAEEKDQARLVQIFYDALPMQAKLSIGPFPVDNETLSAFTKRAEVPLGIISRYGSLSEAGSFAVGSTTSTTTSQYPTPKHGRNKSQSSQQSFQGHRSHSKGPDSRNDSRGRQQRGRSRSRGPPVKHSGGSMSSKFDGTCWYCNFKGHRHLECRKRQSAIKSGDPNPVLNYKPPPIGMIGPVPSGLNSYLVDVEIGNSVIKTIADTGSEYSILRRNMVPTCLLSEVFPANISVPVANGAKMVFDGTLTTYIHVKGTHEAKVKFFISSQLLPDAILGVQALGDLGIVLDCATRSIMVISGAVNVVSSSTTTDTTTPTIQATIPNANDHPARNFDLMAPADQDYPLDAMQHSRLRSLLAAHAELFSDNGRTTTRARMDPVRISLKKDARVPFIDHGGPLLNLTERVLVERQVETWLSDGVIEPSTSSNKTYLLVAYNRKGKPRVCPAFLSLNAATIFDPYPMPTPDAIRREVGNLQIFSVIDLKSAFTSMPLDANSRDFTTFTYNDRRYRLTCSQWGLLNSATSFQRYIDSVVSDLAGVSVYMDDILVYAPNVDTMLMRLRFLFNRLREANLIINSEKCKLLKRAVPYLGNVLQHGIVRRILLE